MDRVFGAYFHAFNKNEDLYRQPSLNGNYTLYETTMKLKPMKIQ